MVAVPVARVLPEPVFAVMTATPGTSAVTFPLLDTFATAELFVDQLMPGVMMAPFPSRTTAVS